MEKKHKYFRRPCSRCGEMFERNGKDQKICDKCNKTLNKKFITIKLK